MLYFVEQIGKAQDIEGLFKKAEQLGLRNAAQAPARWGEHVGFRRRSCLRTFDPCAQSTHLL